jgi:hypothetical protein
LYFGRKLLAVVAEEEEVVVVVLDQGINWAES